MTVSDSCWVVHGLKACYTLTGDNGVGLLAVHYAHKHKQTHILLRNTQCVSLFKKLRISRILWDVVLL